MAQKPGDKAEPSLQLPPLRVPALVRRRRQPEPDAAGPTTPTTPAGDAPGRSSVADTGRPLPRPAGATAVALTGGLVGVGGAAAVYTALAGCEAARGVSSCGGAPGLLVLTGIIALMVLAGSALLTAFEAPDPRSTSLLAVGLVAVVALLFLLDVLLSPWMFVVVPALSAASYSLAAWVTRLGEEAGGRSDWR